MNGGLKRRLPASAGRSLACVVGKPCNPGQEQQSAGKRGRFAGGTSMSQRKSGRPKATGFLVLLLSTISAGIAAADDCSNERSLRSTPSTQASKLSFLNGSGQKRRVFAVDQNGERRSGGTVVGAASVLDQQTSVGEAWIVTDEDGKCLHTFVASATPQVVEVGATSVATASADPPPTMDVDGSAADAATAPIFAPPTTCSAETSLRAISGNPPIILLFANRSSEPRRIYWIDYNGKRKFYGIVAPGKDRRQKSSSGNHWVVTDESETCLGILAVSSTSNALDIGALKRPGTN